MFRPPTVFATERLSLRAPVIDDAEAIFDEYATDPEVTRYLTWVPHSTREGVELFLQGAIDRWQSGDEFSWVLTERANDRPMGMIAARLRGHRADIGYVLARAYWRRGFMSEAIKVVTQSMLTGPGVFRVWAVCDTENTGSARALEKAGFEREGMLRRWIIHPNQSPEPRDCFVYGRVR